MNTIELWRNGRLRRFSGPSTWAELSEHQMVALTRLRMGIARQPEQVFVALRLLYRMPPRVLRWLFDERLLRRRGMSETDIDLTLQIGQGLLDTLAWVGEPAARFPTVFRLFDYQFGTPRTWWGRLWYRQPYGGPLDALAGETFATFMFADRAFRSKNSPLLAAVLCRPLHPETGKPVPLDRAGLERQADRFARLDPALLHWIRDAFGATMLGLQRQFPYVFPKGASDDGESRKAEPSGSYWLDIAINMAQLDATKIAAIEELNLYLALKVLNEQIRQAEEMESRLAEMNK